MTEREERFVSKLAKKIYAGTNFIAFTIEFFLASVTRPANGLVPDKIRKAIMVFPGLVSLSKEYNLHRKNNPESFSLV